MNFISKLVTTNMAILHILSTAPASAAEAFTSSEPQTKQSSSLQQRSLLQLIAEAFNGLELRFLPILF